MLIFTHIEVSRFARKSGYRCLWIFVFATAWGNSELSSSASKNIFDCI